MTHRATTGTGEAALRSELMRLIGAMATGDQAAFAQFYDITSRQIHAVTLRILQEPAVAEEVTMDVYMQVWRQAVRYDETRGSPWAWLMSIAHSLAVARLRALRRERRRIDAGEMAEEIEDAAPRPDDRTIESERARRIEAALALLLPQQRQILMLSYFSGYSHGEIADRLSMPLGTVKTHIRIALRRLREILLPHEQSEL
jgi:RNA polymerase sigma-70 factor (ECF subfamily)